ncbi:hypothetical protein ACHAQJ_001155 [Trichoderma viride]
MSNALKRRFDPIRELNDDDFLSITTTITSGTDISQPYGQEIWQNYGALLDAPRQSQYHGPSYMNPASDIPVMQPMDSITDVISGIFFDQSVGDQMSTLNINEQDYNLDGALLEWGNGIALSDSDFSGLAQVSSHEMSHSPSLTPESSQSRSEDMFMTDDQEQICYGMLHNVDVKLIGEMQAIHSRLDKMEAMYEHFKIKKQDDHVLLSFQDAEDDGSGDFGYLRSAVGKTLVPLLALSYINFEPMGQACSLKDIIGRANKPSEAIAKVDINLYGPQWAAAEVGDTLSHGKLWLQKSSHMKRGVTYDNPHFLRLKINGVQMQSMQSVNQTSNEGPTCKKNREERLRKMVEEVYKSLDRSRDVDMVEGGDRVNKELLKITRAKIKNGIRPNERGGGILADEMGMGKSLSILALIMNTLDDGKAWVQQQVNSTTVEEAIRRSRSTLVIVPSALLVYNWMNEIKKHLKNGVKVIKYHGSDRPKDIDTVSDSDIVVTTYSTLTTEFQNKLIKSPLHGIDWYRVVLDEAHIIRRRATVFYRACDELHANSRWCLTGTPIQNKLADIGTLFAFIRAEPFSKASIFRKWIEVPFDQNADGVKDRLVMLIEALCLRRTKEVIKLPKVRSCLRELEFSSAEREQYEKTKKILMRMIRHRVGEIEKSSHFGLFQVNLQMRLLCNHGTFQRPFSWRRRSYYQDEREAASSALGQNIEITCSGCQLPMPILGSSRLGNGSYGCNHVICSECIEESSSQTEGEQTQRCPVCVSFLGPAMIENGGSTGCGDVQDWPANEKAGGGDDYYFRNEGLSTKMQALIKDVKVDLDKTKRYIPLLLEKENRV